ncbi:uncharacterized protein LAESUDRAFT_662599, partial [Laetiporus sulphureus 93-53]
AFIFFEYMVTFAEEVQVIWGARLTTVTVIFALNRYLLVVQGVSSTLSAVWWHTPLRLIDKLLGFSAFRTYAISGGQIAPALLVLLLGLVPAGANIVIVALICTIPAVIIFARICPAVSDLIVVLVTWFKTSGLAIKVRKLRLKGSIATVLVRDGEYCGSLGTCDALQAANSRHTLLHVCRALSQCLVVTSFFHHSSGPFCFSTSSRS